MKRFLMVALLLAVLPGRIQGQGATRSGNLAGNGQAVTLTVNGFGTAAIQITGTWAATLTFEGTVDGTNWDDTFLAFRTDDFSTAATTTANHTYFWPVAGLAQVRVIMSGYSSGTAAVTLRAVDASIPIPVSVSTPGTVAISGQPIDVNVLTMPAGGSGLTDAELRASPVPVSGTFWQATQPVSGTFWQATQPVSAASLPLPTGAATAANQPVDTHNTTLNSPLIGEVVGGVDVPNDKYYALPIVGNTWAVPGINHQAVSVVIRNTMESSNGAAGTFNTQNFLTVGGGTNASTTRPQRFVFGDGNTFGLSGLPNDPPETWAAQMRDLGQSFGTSGNISAVGQRMSISHRYVVKAASLFNITNNTFIGTIKPVVSFDNGTTWGYVSAINAETGAAFTQLVDAAATGTLINPFCAGSTNCGFEITARTSGDLSYRISGNTQGTNGIFASVVGSVSVTSSALPTGAATAANQATEIASLASIDSKNPALVSGRVPVDGSGVTQPVSGTFWQATQPVSGTFWQATQPVSIAATVTVDSELAAAAALSDTYANPTTAPAGAFVMKWNSGSSQWSRWDGAVTVSGSVAVTGTFWQATQPVSGTVAATQSGTWNIGTVTTLTGITNALPTGSNTIGAVNLAQYTPVSGRLPVDGSGVTQPVSGTFWQATQPVSIAATVSTKEQRAATPAQSSVAASASNVTCLASNSNRLGATIYNDSTADLYIKLGATASTTSFTVKVFQDGYYPIPFNYTGIIDCIWSSATGSARVTEVTQ